MMSSVHFLSLTCSLLICVSVHVVNFVMMEWMVLQLWVLLFYPKQWTNVFWMMSSLVKITKGSVMSPLNFFPIVVQAHVLALNAPP